MDHNSPFVSSQAAWTPASLPRSLNEENDELAFLHVSYGQRTEKRERESFEALADHFKVKSRLVISLEHLAKIGGSSLTDDAIPVTDSRSFSRKEFPRATFLLETLTCWQRP